MIGWMAALALAQGGDPVAPDPRLEAFKTVCIPHRDDLNAAEALLAAEGWVSVADDDHPELAVVMARTRAEFADPELEADGRISVWAKDIAGARYHVSVNRLDAMIGETEDQDENGVIEDWEEAQLFSYIGCGIWDFDAVEPMHPGAMTAWAGSAPIQWFDHEGMIGGTWNVYEMLPGTAEIHVGFFAEGSTWAAQAFSGVSITMSSVPKEQFEAYQAEQAEQAAEAAAAAEADDAD